MTKLPSHKILTPVAIVAFLANMMIIAIVAASGNAEEHNSMSADQESDRILALDKMWSDKVAAGDIDWIMDLQSENAVQLPPMEPILKGKDAIRAAWQGIIDAEGIELSWVPTTVSVSKSGDMAYSYGVGRLKNPDGSVVEAKYAVVWIKEGGEWKAALDIFNTSGPPSK